MKFLKKKYLMFFFLFPLILMAAPIEESPRDYWTELSQEQHANLAFIMSTMSKASHAQIMVSKAKLRQAGRTLSTIHPLRYLEHIFSHPQLTKDLCGISLRTNFLWPGFLNGEDNGVKDGMIGSLKQEDALGNLKPAYIENFTRRCNLSYIQIANCIRLKQWNEMMDYVIREAMKKNRMELYDL